MLVFVCLLVCLLGSYLPPPPPPPFFLLTKKVFFVSSFRREVRSILPDLWSSGFFLSLVLLVTFKCPPPPPPTAHKSWFRLADLYSLLQIGVSPLHDPLSLHTHTTASVSFSMTYPSSQVQTMYDPSSWSPIDVVEECKAFGIGSGDGHAASDSSKKTLFTYD